MCIGGRSVSPFGPVPSSNTFSTCSLVKLGSPASAGARSAQLAIGATGRIQMGAPRSHAAESSWLRSAQPCCRVKLAIWLSRGMALGAFSDLFGQVAPSFDFRLGRRTWQDKTPLECGCRGTNQGRRPTSKRENAPVHSIHGLSPQCPSARLSGSHTLGKRTHFLCKGF